MKNMLRRVMILVVVATMFTMPASTVWAASIPVVISDDIAVSVEFEPDSYYLSPGYAFDFPDYSTSSSEWFVPAGKRFDFAVFTDEARTVARVQIYKNGVLIYDQATVSTVYSHQYHVQAEGTNNTYRVIITALSDMHIDSYAVFRR